MTSLLPPNATPMEKAVETAMARIGDVPTPVESLWRPGSCPASLLPYLAYNLSIDNWLPDWPESVKRERIRQAIPIQRMKGTVSSVRAIVAALGGAIALREWWETSPRGDPHTFDLVLSVREVAGGAPSAAYVDSIIDDIRRTKPVRSHFTFTLATEAAGAVGIIGAVRPMVYARLACVAPFY